jgi:hypothetical protein
VVWCPFTVNWWLLCSVSIGRSNSPTILCHQSRNWMAGSWSSVEWILWHLHWCNCCSVSVKNDYFLWQGNMKDFNLIISED